MSDLLDIEVDGNPPPTGRQRDDGTPSWGMPAAIAVAGVLLLVVLVVVVAPMVRPTGGGRSSDSAPKPSASLAKPENEILAAARAALSAWGRFAGSGDLTVLSRHFHEDGPQYRQLVDEAPRIAAARLSAGEYQVVSDGMVKSLSADRAEVRATVVWQRPGESDQRKVWSIELRNSRGENWAVWTVRSARENAS
jgi:hypothetical protein